MSFANQPWKSSQKNITAEHWVDDKDLFNLHGLRAWNINSGKWETNKLKISA